MLKFAKILFKEYKAYLILVLITFLLSVLGVVGIVLTNNRFEDINLSSRKCDIYRYQTELNQYQIDCGKKKRRKVASIFAIIIAIILCLPIVGFGRDIFLEIRKSQ